jgi:hypothetical protein
MKHLGIGIGLAMTRALSAHSSLFTFHKSTGSMNQEKIIRKGPHKAFQLLAVSILQSKVSNCGM